jgi:hypothetical protein
MNYAGTQLTWPQSEAGQAIDDYDAAEAEAEANKHRRKFQNRKNQRAHRQYSLRDYDPSCTQKPLQDYGSKPETRAIVRSDACSGTGAGSSTSSTIFPPKKSREHLQSAQQPLQASLQTWLCSSREPSTIALRQSKRERELSQCLFQTKCL